ncbi:MAG: AI-2E family transporter [Clostridia bacterium]|jgi:predicted PurR-regulated permease PerM|nr:AI-2E family transporter [Clostridia bacterium]
MKDYGKYLHIFRGALFWGALLWFIYAVRSVLTPFALGFFLAYLLNPLVDRLEKKGISRIFAIAILYIFLAVLAGGAILYGVPVLLRDLNSLAEVIPQYTEAAQKMVDEFQLRYSRVPLPESIRQVGDGVISSVENTSIGLLKDTVTSILHLFSQTFNILLAPLLGFYFLIDYHALGPKILQLVPVRYRANLSSLSHEIDVMIKNVIRGNLLVATLVAVLATAGMLLIGMDYPLLIGLLVGLTNFIPYFGAFISTVPIVILALLKSKWLALYVLGVMVLIQQVEGNIISPKILGGYIGLHPLVIIFALLAGGSLWGFLGLLLAVPAAAVLKVLLYHAYTRLV